MKNRGFSLLESMVAMGLVFLVLGLVSTLMQEYSTVSRHDADRDSTLDGVQHALAEMVSEFSSAIEVKQPDEGSSASLVFTRLDPNPSTPRLPPRSATQALAEDGDSPRWDFRPENQLLKVTYKIKNNSTNLIRRVKDGNEAVLAKNVTAFNVTKRNNYHYLLSISFQEKNRLRSFSILAKTWLKPEPKNN